MPDHILESMDFRMSYTNLDEQLLTLVVLPH